MTQVDFTGSGGKELIDQGVYPCTVTGMEIKRSENTGNDYYAFEFTVASGQWEGYRLWHNNTINAKDRNYYLRTTLEGITGEEFPLEIMDINPAEYIGRGCQVQVIHDEYQGKLKAQVAAIHPPSDGMEPSGDVPPGMSAEDDYPF